MKRLTSLPIICAVIVLAAVPLAAQTMEQPYLLTLVTRGMILGLAALGLNLILGFGGLVSFGHALYIGLGAYAVGILELQGIHNGWVQIAIIMLLSAAVALPVGALCLRTSGMAFIMITLAFGQMFYFLAIGFKGLGGDDGMSLPRRSEFWPLSVEQNGSFYWLVLSILAVTLFLSYRLVGSRFGTALLAAKINARRLEALGCPVYYHKLVAYLVSASICALAGALLANLTRYTSPAYLQWTLSGELIVMCVLGGMGSLLGPVLGAFAIVGLEDVLAHLDLGGFTRLNEVITAHWQGVLGLFIVAVTLTLKQGLYGLLLANPRRH